MRGCTSSNKVEAGRMIAEVENLRKKVIEAAEQAVPMLDEAISRFRNTLNADFRSSPDDKRAVLPDGSLLLR
jgi:hypothetical protein